MPDWKNEIRKVLSELALPPVREAEIVEELSQHLEDRYEDLLLRGYAEDVADQETLSELRQSEMIRDLRRVELAYSEPVELGQEARSTLTGLSQDLRYAFRMLIRQPGITLVAVVTMALGIGVNTTIFSSVQLLAFRPFDFANQDRLVMVWEQQRETGLTRGSVAPGNFADWREQNQTFEDLVAIKSSYFDLANASQPERLRGNLVSTGFFAALGTPAVVGRVLSSEDNEPGRNNVVVLSDGLWRTHFGADPQIVGRSVKLNAETYTIVGVMPKGFQYPVDDSQLWVPLVPGPNDRNERRYHNLQVVGLPRTGVSLTQATEDLNRISVGLQTEFPDTNRGREARVVPLVKDATRGVRVAVPFMFVSVLLVLLVACANVANILLVRAAAQQRDIAIRLALGASRFRVMRQLLADSLLLSGIGGGIGLLFAHFGIKALKSMPQDFSMFIPGWGKMGIDETALGFTLVVSVLTGVLCGLIPALIGTRVELNQALKDDGPSVLGKHSNRATRWLVISEVAFSVVLLMGAGIVFRSFQRLLDTDFGVNPTNVLTMQISLSGERYETAQSRINFVNALTEKVSSLPGITDVGLASTLPLGYVYNRREVVSVGSTVFAQRKPSVTWRLVTPGYLEAMGTPLRQGRAFTDQDRESTPRVALVNEAFVKQFLSGEQVIGELFSLRDGQRYEIVGLLANVINDDLEERADAEIYVPYAQEPNRDLFLVTRSVSMSETLAMAIRQEVSVVDPSTPVSKVKPLQQFVDERLSAKRMAVYSLGIGALIALLLAAVGIYSVVAYSVTQRTQEIGLRLALGASRMDILKLVVGTGLRPVLIGSAIGLAGALVLTQLLTGLLFGVSARDPITLVAISSILAAVSLLACYLPARRAMKLDPLLALRYQ